MTEEHKEKLKLAREQARALKAGSVVSPEKNSSFSKTDEVEEREDSIMGMLKGLTESMGSINKRLTRIETGGVNEFQEKAKPEDVEKAAGSRRGVDPRIVEIVNRTLGEDFGIDIGTFPDRPGYLFTLIVPPRLSDNQASERPLKDPETGAYQKDKAGNVVTETYFPEDRRSRALSSEHSFDAIKEHCERVRSYIVAYYTKMSKPLPEFKLK